MTKKGKQSLALGVAAVLAVPLLAAGRPQDTADLVLRNGRVVTVDPAQPEAQAVAIKGDRIVAVGTDADVLRLIGPKTEVVDLAGKLAIPGFIESHGHFLDLGHAKMILDLTKARSWDEIVAMVAAAAREAEPGAWITGRGWHQERWQQTPEPSVETTIAATKSTAASTASENSHWKKAKKPRMITTSCRLAMMAETARATSPCRSTNAFSAARCVSDNSSNCSIRAWNSGDFIVPSRETEPLGRTSLYITSEQSQSTGPTALGSRPNALSRRWPDAGSRPAIARSASAAPASFFAAAS